MVENVRFRHSLLFQLCYSIRWMQNLLFLSYSEDNVSFHNLFIKNKNIIHSAWTHFLKPNFLNGIGQLLLFLPRPCLTLGCLYLLSFPSSANNYGFWLTGIEGRQVSGKADSFIYLCYQPYVLCLLKNRNDTDLDTVITWFLFEVIVHCSEEGRIFYVC